MKVRLGDYIQEYSVKNKDDENISVYSVTNTKGFCKDYFGKEVASKDKTTYKIVPYGYFAYNPSRINVGSVDWQRKEKKVIISPLYNVFSVSPNLERQYLYYYLKSDFVLQRIKAVATGSVRDNLKLSMLYEFPIELPKLENQRKIVKILDKVSDVIEKKEQELEQLETLVKSRFVEMFANKGYSVLKWNDVFDTTTGKLDSNAATEDGEYPFFTCSKEVLRIDKFAFNQEALLLAGNNAAGKYDVKYYNGKFNAYQRTYVLKLKGDWSYQLFRYQLEDKLIYLQQQSLGGLTKYLTMKILAELDFIMPPIDSQIEFEQFVNQVDKSKSKIQKSLEETQRLFDSLMQKYFG